MVFSLVNVMSFADDDYSDFEIEKVSNPGSFSGEPDGINTNDETGFEANRYNSYAWAMEELGGCLYVGTNRNLYGGAMAAIARQMQAAVGADYEETMKKFMKLANVLTDGAVPDATEMTDEDWIPQIIKIDPETGTTKVVFRPDMSDVNPASEVCSFRSVIKFNNKLYFGSLGTTRLQIVCIDENDNADVVYNVKAQGSSLRACATWKDSIVFGGLDGALTPAPDSEYAGMFPMVIKMMNPANPEEWTVIGDFKDFIPYADETVYAAAGGTVWDLISYEGRLYCILASDDGFVMFRGEEATEATQKDANEYGYVWTCIIGEGGKYNPGMADTPEGLNHGEGDVLGVKDSTATPYVFNGRMYIGTFDNDTSLLVNAFTDILKRVNDIENGPSLSQIYGGIYNAVMDQERMYVMDENENIEPVESFNKLLEGTNDDYVWRMKEYNGKLYVTTHDPSTIWAYVASFKNITIVDLSQAEEAMSIASDAQSFAVKMRDGDVTDSDDATGSDIVIPIDTGDVERALQVAMIAARYSLLVRSYIDGEISPEQLADGIDALHAELEAIIPDIENETLLKEANTLLSLLNKADAEGIRMLVEINRRVTTADKGFSMYVSEDGVNFTELFNNGLNDEYNYGGRTLAVCNDRLYIGTANPFYGAQIWKLTDNTPAEELLIGDANGDEVINTADAVVVLKYSAGMVTFENDDMAKCADTNYDGVVNTADAVVILRYAAGMITEI